MRPEDRGIQPGEERKVVGRKSRCIHRKPREWEACSLGSCPPRYPHTVWECRQQSDFSCTWCKEH